MNEWEMGVNLSLTCGERLGVYSLGQLQTPLVESLGCFSIALQPSISLFLGAAGAKGGSPLLVVSCRDYAGLPDGDSRRGRI